MQETSALYKKIIQGEHWFETSVTIGDSGRLTDERGDVITFGGDSILVDTGGPESGFREDRLFEVNTKAPFFKDSTPCVGAAVSGTANIKMIAPFNIPKKARIYIYSRTTQINRNGYSRAFTSSTRESKSMTSVGLMCCLLKPLTQ